MERGPNDPVSLNEWRQQRQQEKDDLEARHERSPQNDVLLSMLYLRDLLHPRHGMDVLNTILADLQEPEIKPPKVAYQTHLFRRHLISITEDAAYDQPLTDHEPYEDLFVAAWRDSRNNFPRQKALETVERLHRVSLSQPDINTVPNERIPAIIARIMRNTPHDPYAS